MHPTGKMLLALYDNGVLRLWNLMDARCHFKRKVGIFDGEESEEEEVSEDKDDDEDDEAGEDEQIELNEKPQNLSEVNRKAQNVVWSPDGNMFVILYRRMLEVHDLKQILPGGKPAFRTVLDYPTNTITWLNESTLIVADERGNLIRLNGIGSKQVQLNLMETKFKRLRQLKAFEGKFLAAIVHDEGEGKIVFWSTDSILEAKDLDRPKPALVLKLNVGRLTSLNVQRASLKRKKSKF